jgi:type VI secretion system protein ImpH
MSTADGAVEPTAGPTTPVESQPPTGLPSPVPSPVPGRVASGSTVPAPRPEEANRLLDMLARAPYAFDFFQALRRLECAFRDRPRIGTTTRPSEEPIRLGQEPSMAFAPAELSALRPGRAGGPPWLLVHFMGLLGPNGPLPLHLTEFARDRQRNAGDPTMARFLDLFHHRMLSLFYRAWANGQPTVNRDRPESDRFGVYTGALAGLAMRVLGNANEFPDSAKFFYAGLLGGQTHHASGLGSMIGEFFGMPTTIEEFVGDWLEIPPPNLWALGRHDQRGALGLSTPLGARTWTRQQKFRVVLGPLDRGQFRRMLPGGDSLRRLRDVVRSYVGDEFRWDVRLSLHERVDEPLHLGRSHLGWTAWLGKAVGSQREDLILDPQSEAVLAAS